MSEAKRPEVGRHYDKNTRWFLAFGRDHGSRHIHQPLWPAGTPDLATALTESLRLIGARLSPNDGHFLDLGCGVGSSMAYLSERVLPQARFTGVTISREQVQIAKQKLADFPHLTFKHADFLDLPFSGPFDGAYAIEAFLHARDAGKFFSEAGRVLRAGASLVLVDDFLSNRFEKETPSDRVQKWLADFKSGWMAGSLVTVPEASTLAAESGFELLESQNLTPLMHIGRPRDRLIGVMIALAGPLMRRHSYFNMMVGGFAKQQCLRTDWVNYRLLHFRKKVSS